MFKNTSEKLFLLKCREDEYFVVQNCYKLCHKELEVQTDFDCLDSGSTATTLVVVQDRLIAFNLGNSKAILGYQEGEEMCYRCLTSEHTAQVETERKRLEHCGARLETAPFKDLRDDKMYRIYLKYEDKPGLITSRTVGDLHAKRIGVSSHPSWEEFVLDQNSKWILLASDGLWAVMNEKEATKIMFENYKKWKSPERAVHELITEAKVRWLEVLV